MEKMKVYTCFPGGKAKALTMSYDDGKVQDRGKQVYTFIFSILFYCNFYCGFNNMMIFIPHVFISWWENAPA